MDQFVTLGFTSFREDVCVPALLLAALTVSLVREALSSSSPQESGQATLGLSACTQQLSSKGPAMAFST